jgi:hypothetical protein
MLWILLSYSFITLVCFWAGILIYTLPFFRENRNRPLFFYFITGLIGLTAFGQVLVLFFPLIPIILWLIILMMAILTFFSWKVVSSELRQLYENRKKVGWLPLIAGASLILMILTLNAGPTVMDDTDSYHIQMVKWAQEFGTVPGIANLHVRFGFNSSWFISIALLSPRISGINGYLVLNGVLSVWLALYMLEKIFGGINESKENISIPVLALLVLALLNWPIIRGNACSANYDFISTCCILGLFIEKNREGHHALSFEWLIWPVYLCTIRLINSPLLLLSLYSLVKIERKQRLFILISCLFVGSPILARNLILSGYLFFPVYQLDFFGVDWKVDRAQLADMMAYIKYFNRVNPMFEPLSKTMSLGFPEWIWAWYKNLFRFDQWLVSISLLCFAAIFARWKKFFGKAKAVDRVFLITMIIQLLCWFLVAPDPRFVYGPLLFGIFLLVSQFHFLWVKSGFQILRISTFLMSILVLGYTTQKIITNSNYRNWIEPKPLPKPPFRNIVVDGIEMHIPEKILDNWNPRCYDIALPCLYKPDPRLEARGKSLRQGFRISRSKSSDQVEGEYNITE